MDLETSQTGSRSRLFTRPKSRNTETILSGRLTKRSFSDEEKDEADDIVESKFDTSPRVQIKEKGKYSQFKFDPNSNFDPESFYLSEEFILQQNTRNKELSLSNLDIKNNAQPESEHGVSHVPFSQNSQNNQKSQKNQAKISSKNPPNEY